MGGAVAVLCTLRLLRALGATIARPLVSCFCFGTPAVGTSSLAATVDSHGWSTHFVSYALPGQRWPSAKFLGGPRVSAVCADFCWCCCRGFGASFDGGTDAVRSSVSCIERRRSWKTT